MKPLDVLIDAQHVKQADEALNEAAAAAERAASLYAEVKIWNHAARARTAARLLRNLART